MQPTNLKGPLIQPIRNRRPCQTRQQLLNKTWLSLTVDSSGKDLALPPWQHGQLTPNPKESSRIAQKRITSCRTVLFRIRNPPLCFFGPSHEFNPLFFYVLPIYQPP